MVETNRKQIIYVEADHSKASQLKHKLEEYNYSVILIDTGEKAVDFVSKSNEVDLILMAMELGDGIDGADTAKLILAGKSLPILFCCNSSNTDTLRKTENIPCYGFLPEKMELPVADASIKAALRMFKSNSNSERAREESLYKTFVEEAKDMFYRMSLPDGKYEYVSPASSYITGFTPEEHYVGSPMIREIIHPEWREYLEAHWKKLMDGVMPPEYEYQIIDRSGKTKWINQRNVLIRDRSNNPVAIDGILTDITASRQIEAEINEIKQSYERLLDNADEMVLRYDISLKTVGFLNPAAERLLGYPVAQWLSEPNLGRRITHPDYQERQKEIINQVITSKKTIKNVVICLITIDGQSLIFELSMIPILDACDIVVFIEMIGHDITQRKRAEEQIQKAFNEKKALLKELQHRVKNTFNMLAGIIRLTADLSTGEETKTALGDIYAKIIAVSEMYQLLYQSDVLASVNLKQYLTRIEKSLLHVAKNIEIHSSFSSIELSSKSAIPVGIITAELITNSIKHAFPESQNGVITISLKEQDGRAALVVEDDGVGLPEDFNLLASNSLGFKLVYSLSEQIGGSFKYENRKGASFTLEFPI